VHDFDFDVRVGPFVIALRWFGLHTTLSNAQRATSAQAQAQCAYFAVFALFVFALLGFSLFFRVTIRLTERGSERQ
jgi:hypothetical protein